MKIERIYKILGLLPVILAMMSDVVVGVTVQVRLSDIDVEDATEDAPPEHATTINKLKEKIKELSGIPTKNQWLYVRKGQYLTRGDNTCRAAGIITTKKGKATSYPVTLVVRKDIEEGSETAAAEDVSVSTVPQVFVRMAIGRGVCATSTIKFDRTTTVGELKERIQAEQARYEMSEDVIPAAEQRLFNSRIAKELGPDSKKCDDAGMKNGDVLLLFPPLEMVAVEGGEEGIDWLQKLRQVQLHVASVKHELDDLYPRERALKQKSKKLVEEGSSSMEYWDVQAQLLLITKEIKRMEDNLAHLTDEVGVIEGRLRVQRSM
jgi:molybdopterin converting factor small subunit